MLDSWAVKRTQFKIVQINETHRRIEVYTKSGYVFALTIAAETDEPTTTRKYCEYNWISSRREFIPFDSSVGTYV